ncbi:MULTISPECIES: type II toxin-antitoxin system HigB family toxin [unclassified Variovorax]|uniref:type II toxin-antitoxin system HigB family toxin n=1 Tax=unclassified Variovorax TaxID=663243 RepID=UPI003ECD04D6
MRIISVKYLRDFGVRHPASEQPLKAWHEEAKAAVWKTPQDIKDRYRSARFVGSNRVVFNIKGNDYRLIAAIAYRYEAVCVKFIGTHSEYDRIDAQPIEVE